MSATPFGKKSGSTAVHVPPTFEVLPPEGKGGAHPGTPASPAPGRRLISRLIAYVMDNLVKSPARRRAWASIRSWTCMPLVGDGAAMFISAATILEGARRGVPKPVLARMGLNILLNGLVGTIPGVGRGVRVLVQAVVAQLPASRPAHARRPAPRAQDHLEAIGRLSSPWSPGLLIVLGAFVGIGIYFIGWLFHALVHLFGH